MFIHSIRYGFACNSSSTHSCVIYKGDFNTETLEDEKEKFGWDYFTLSNSSTIRIYFFTMLKEQIKHIASESVSTISDEIGEDNKKRLKEKLIDLLTPEKISRWLTENSKQDTYVDHQSCYSFPVQHLHQKLINEEFFTDFIEAVIQTPNFLILGGNDNDGGIHELDDCTEEIKGVIGAILNYLPQDGGFTDVVGVKDKELNYYTLINKKNGNRLRLSFIDTPINYSSFPQLVDLKITDYCDKGCSFCYQSSTKEGKHADYHWIKKIIDELAKGECLEIALGGGEPTSHPDFIAILKRIRSKGMIANFTTKSKNWLKNSIDYREILEYANSIALSINSASELISYLVALNEIDYSLYDVNFSVQVVLGTVTLDTLKEIRYICNSEKLRLILLGFKEVGFGKNYPKIEYLNWIEEFMFSHENPINISIDSALMSEIKNIIKNNVNPLLYTDREGHYSCYIDACTEVLYKDSYSTISGYDLKGNQKDSQKEKYSIYNQYRQMQIENKIRKQY